RALSEQDARLCKTASIYALSLFVGQLLREKDLDVLKPKYALVDNVVRLLRRRNDETLATVEPYARMLSEKILGMEHARQQALKPQVSSAGGPLGASTQAAQSNPINGHAAASSSPAIARPPVQAPPQHAAPLSNGATPTVHKSPKPQQAHSSAPKVTATHAMKRPTPDKNAAPQVKQKRVENPSAAQTAPLDMRNLQSVLAQLSLEMRILFTDSLTRSELSLGGKRQLLKSFMELHAKNELNAQSFGIILAKILEGERKERRAPSSSTSASRAQTSEVSSTHPITLTDSPDRSATAPHNAEQSSHAVTASSAATHRSELDAAIGCERPPVAKAQPKPPSTAMSSPSGTIPDSSKMAQLKLSQVREQQRLQMQNVKHAPAQRRSLSQSQGLPSPRAPPIGPKPSAPVQPRQNVPSPLLPTPPPKHQNVASAKPDTPIAALTEKDEHFIKLFAEKHNISPSKLSREQLLQIARMHVQSRAQPQSSSSTSASGATQRLHKVQEKVIAKLPRAPIMPPPRTPPRMLGMYSTLDRCASDTLEHCVHVDHHSVGFTVLFSNEAATSTAE
ncbi:hypothetical protein AAVH_32306, partial [Aphelenchoides avenae]